MKNSLKIAIAALLCAMLGSNATFGAPTTEQINKFKHSLQQVHTSIAQEAAQLFESEALNKHFTFTETISESHGNMHGAVMVPNTFQMDGSGQVAHLLALASETCPNRISALLQNIYTMLNTIKLAEASSTHNGSYNEARILSLRKYRNAILEDAIPVLTNLDITRETESQKRTDYVNRLRNKLNQSLQASQARTQNENDNNTVKRIREELISLAAKIKTVLTSSTNDVDANTDHRQPEQTELSTHKHTRSDDDAPRTNIKKARADNDNNNNNA